MSTTSGTFHCWNCSQQLNGVLLPMSRREVCTFCNADLHVCKLCENYRPDLSGACAEDRAEGMINKESANFCDYFKAIDIGVEEKESSQRYEVESELAALFGDGPPAEEKTAQSEAHRARAELDALFK